MNKNVEKLIELLENSVRKSLPKEKFGVLLSGGLDSSILTLLLKKFKANFTCYVVEFHHPNFKKADDIEYAKLLTKKLGLSLKIVKVNLSEVKKVLPKIMKIIKRNEVPMVSIALAIYFCFKKANSDKIKTVLYDCACDCVFAGLHKHKISKNLRQTCIDSLQSTYDKDLPRDRALAKHFNIKLESPFLDKDLTSFALALPNKYKINKKTGTQKYLLREAALKLGLPESIALRKKRAIQYSSNAQKMIEKLARQNGFKKKQDYLLTLKKP